MYELWFIVELAAAFLLLILGWIAGSKASALVYRGSAEKLRRKSRGLMVWAGVLFVLTAGAVASIAMVVRSMDTLFWVDRAYLHAPLLLLPILAVLLVSVPDLVRLFRATSGRSGVPDAHLRRLASKPGLVVPFQAVPLAALAVVYFIFVPPVPIELLDAGLPPILFLLAVTALWALHTRRHQAVSRPDAVVVSRPWLRALRNLTVLAAAVAAAGFLFYSVMRDSRLPGRLDMMAGPADYGGGPVVAHAGHGHRGAAAAAAAVGAVSVTDLTGPRSEEPDRRFTLTAKKAVVRLSSGKTVEAWTYNGSIPGPEIRLKEGELVEVTLLNEDIEDGVTIHWHGLDVPNAEDGVAGATQDAVMPGQKHVYRFRTEQTGTFWYHSHQVSQEAVSKGLFGPLIVEPRDSPATPQEQDITVISHIWQGAGIAIGSSDEVRRFAVQPGTNVRLRLINTDDWVLQKYVLSGTSFKVAAIDGEELHEPGELTNTELQLTTGGRYDVTFTMPDSPVFLSVGGGKSHGVFLSPDGKGTIPALPQNQAVFDPLHYGKQVPTPFDKNSRFDRSFTMVLDNKLGFYNGSFDQLYTINGAVFPDTPMFMVKEGELIKATIVNRSMVEHPMHLHGHHMLVLSRSGEPAAGSPWWTDTLSVEPGDTYEVAFKADNPGLWMDHCHNLQHAAVGMSMHLMYEGVTSPFAVGSETGNHPE